MNAINENQRPIGSPFGHFTTAAEVINGIDLTGKNAVVTGGYTGTGLEIVKAFAAAGARVICLARDTKRAKRNLRGVSNAEIEYFDLLKPETIDAAAQKVLDRDIPIHILVNNAGIIGIPRTLDKRGIEYHFATNHLGHFQLTARLFPALKRAHGARVVAVSSRAHREGGVNFDDINFERTEYKPMRAYAQSKSANVLFAVRLDNLAKRYGVRAFAVHPGPIPTSDLFAESVVGIRSRFTVGLLRGAAKFMRAINFTGIYNALKKPDVPDAFKTVAQGAATGVWAATAKELDNLGGLYCEDCDIAKAAAADVYEPTGVQPWAIDTDASERLWQISEKMTGVRFVELAEENSNPIINETEV
ncbi:MAG: SDR family NAD(P)-dependent oxidoreductase [Clostridiales bacterium]|jgi:NAD(P)-dependent dehydrogenase (short-subunit alcohol dehydrogenase family)|nr:SDR family NAD(P)-dependent oxidoreductase [Clostridiales bacterium]